MTTGELIKLLGQLTDDAEIRLQGEDAVEDWALEIGDVYGDGERAVIAIHAGGDIDVDAQTERIEGIQKELGEPSDDD